MLLIFIFCVLLLLERKRSNEEFLALRKKWSKPIAINECWTTTLPQKMAFIVIGEK